MLTVIFNICQVSYNVVHQQSVWIYILTNMRVCVYVCVYVYMYDVCR